MATDHYTRLGIEKEKFYELDEKGKEELVEKQFRGLTGSLLSKLFDIFFPGLAEKRLVKLRDARDILKDDKMREHYNSFVDSKVITENITYSELEGAIKSSELKADNIDEKENITIDHNNNQSQEQTKNNNTKSLSLDEQIEQIKEKLEKIKTDKGGKERDITRNETVSKVITHLESELKKLNELNSQSKQLEQEKSANQAKSDTEKNMNKKVPKIPITTSVTANLADRHNLSNANKVNLNSKSAPPKPPRLSLNKQIQQQEEVLAKMKMRFHEGLKEAGIDTKGMSDKEIQNELRYMGTLPLQFENILNTKGELLELNNKRAEIDKLNHESKHDINCIK
ncbi:MAG: hypothetical protein U0X86_000822 [Wolbachia endosymbiont of Xenopsylla cheopis]